MKTEGIEPIEILHRLITLKPLKHGFEMEDEPESNQNTVITTIDTSKAKLINKHVHQLVKHPLLESYSLSQQDVMVIADLWQFHLELPCRGSSLASITASAKIRRYQATECLKYITGLLECNTICFDEKIDRNHYFNPMILQSLGYSPKTSYDVTTKLSSYFQKCQPKQTLGDVIIPASDKQLISQIITKCKPDKFRDLGKWGFKIEGNKQSAVLLLYSAQGTGKTFTAGAIANELHRDLVTLNVHELRNKYYGETEKLIKKAFCEMREMASKDKNAPVFLLNEADQLIHERLACTSICSTIENSIQSIILEELETFPGILILTTNLESDRDEGFFRRFDLKFRFKLPDIESRRNLWKMYLRKEIPGSEAIDIELLAQRYPFCCAQIAMVVQNSYIEAIARTGKSKRLYLQDLLKYADLEIPWADKENKSIGF